MFNKGGSRGGGQKRGSEGGGQEVVSEGVGRIVGRGMRELVRGADERD